MNGFKIKSAFLLSLTGALVLLSGCHGGQHLGKMYDPCWPERYNAMAASSVRGHIAPQVRNGHVLDQTVWNYHFETGTHKLTPGGVAHLNRLARRMPAPDPHIFVQTAIDVPYDQKNPGKFLAYRENLNQNRVHAVQTYLNVQSSHQPTNFVVTLHNPPAVGMPAAGALQSIQARDASFEGVLTITNTTGSGAGSGGGSGGGGR